MKSELTIKISEMVTYCGEYGYYVETLQTSVDSTFSSVGDISGSVRKCITHILMNEQRIDRKYENPVSYELNTNTPSAYYNIWDNFNVFDEILNTTNQEVLDAFYEETVTVGGETSEGGTTTTTVLKNTLIDSWILRLPQQTNSITSTLNSITSYCLDNAERAGMVMQFEEQGKMTGQKTKIEYGQKIFIDMGWKSFIEDFNVSCHIPTYVR